MRKVQVFNSFNSLTHLNLGNPYPELTSYHHSTFPHCKGNVSQRKQFQEIRQKNSLKKKEEISVNKRNTEAPQIQSSYRDFELIWWNFNEKLLKAIYFGINNHLSVYCFFQLKQSKATTCL